ncbi:MAG TPA: thiolase [Steroidobacter sp.]
MSSCGEGFTRGSSAIVGAATFGLGEAPGWTSIELAAMAAVRALADAGLQPSDADALFACLPDDVFATMACAEHLGIRPRLTDNNRTGGSAFLTHVIHAAAALESGACDVALIMYGSNQRTSIGKLQTPRRPSAFEAPYRPLTPISSYALVAARHMYQYGTTREQLAAVAVAARQWANLNPDAFARGDLTIEQCLGARMVSDPLTTRDCCLVTDGAAAIVMTRADRARHSPKPAVFVLGGAAATWHDGIAQMPDLTVTAAKESGARAFAHAGIAPSDVDVVQLYDAFTINTILFLEDLGFCAKGEGGAFVQSGAIAPGGTLPVNTNGGGLSCVHPGMYGLFALVEARQQLAALGGGRQVKDAQIAVAHGNGLVLSSQATVILGTAATV